MLVELAVSNLGVIESARVPLHPGLVALTGETGAGKTMLIEALNLLAGRKADPGRVRSGASEAVVEGLFVDGEREWVLRRVVPVDGRSRAYVDGQLATASTLSELAEQLLELHGQHGAQELFTSAAHRDALDAFGAIDTGVLEGIRARIREVRTRLDDAGGDERGRLREMELLEYQITEIDQAAIHVGEDRELSEEHDVLADAVAHREAAQQAVAYLGDDGGAVDLIAAARVGIADRGPFVEPAQRLEALAAEASDLLSELRTLADSIEPDPERLARVRERRQMLVELRRKYGDDEQEIIDFADEARTRLLEIRSHEETRLRLGEELVALHDELEAECAAVGAARRRVAPELASRIESELRSLAMPNARMEIRVEDTPELPGAGAAVEFMIAANPGSRVGALGKVASGGELSRVMLALRLVLSKSPPTSVFDEVDAGIGGQAAVSVGRALAEVASHRQVLVVTHLPQVAAFADAHIRIEKSAGTHAASTTATDLGPEERVIELSRMMTGSPESDSARAHALDLLENAGRVGRRVPR